MYLCSDLLGATKVVARNFGMAWLGPRSWKITNTSPVKSKGRLRRDPYMLLCTMSSWTTCGREEQRAATSRMVSLQDGEVGQLVEP